MEKHTPHILNCGLLALLLFVANTVHAGAPASPKVLDAVVLTAWLHVEDLTMADVLVELEVDGVLQTGHVPENGRFEMSLPADVDAVLRFSKPGHLTKEVVVDTHHVTDGGFDGKKRHVSFAVILQQERHMAGFTYPGPVGSLGFDEGGGCLAVAHDRSVVPAERRTIMVF
ncbi:MAG: hypothetical protein IPO90_15520 [Flavobacteriales bacterium]|nr:hypothetical protein [Flavobacteriales bacterium]MBL0044916.1 hypothetical protein [Flavobacteriales bacterium]